MGFDPNAAAADWATRLSGSRDKIQRGVQGVTVAPGQAAARRKGAYVQGVQNSQDKWAKNVGAVTLTDWQNAFIAKGLDRISTGATQAQPKMVAFMTQLSPYIDQVKSTLPPRGDLSTNINRMVTFVQGMSKFSYNKSA